MGGGSSVFSAMRHGIELIGGSMTRYLPIATRAALAEQLTCRACNGPGPFEADHAHPHTLGGGNEPDNLRHLCKPCHAIKTKTDVKAIAKCKRIARKLAGTWRQPKGRKLTGRGFDKTLRRKMDGTVERCT